MPASRRGAGALIAGLVAWSMAASAAAAALEPAGWLKLDKRLLLEDDAAQLPIYHEASLGLTALPAEQLELHLTGRLRFYDVAITSGLAGLGDPLLIIATMVSLSCAVAVLVGTLVRSVLLGVIITLYGGNQLSAVVVLTSLESIISLQAAALIGIGVAAVVIAVAMLIFVRKVSG